MDLNQYLATYGGQSESSQPTEAPNSVDSYMAKYGGQVQQIDQPTPTDSWESFTQKAKTIAQQRGFPANVLLAQAADESARGQAAPGNNYFGIKGQGTAGSNNLATQEYGNGGYYGENSDFAAYNTPEDSINAYIDLVTSYPGVKEAIASGNPDAVIKAIEAAGYATSPTYVNTIESMPEFQGGAQ